jgi:hypothetical protein
MKMAAAWHQPAKIWHQWRESAGVISGCQRRRKRRRNGNEKSSGGNGVWRNNENNNNISVK